MKVHQQAARQLKIRCLPRLTIEGPVTNMKARATEDFGHLGKFYSEGDVLSLDLDQALHLLEAGSVEPVVNLEPFRPPSSINGLSSWEAYLLHVRHFPPLQPLLDEANLDPQPYRLRVRDYSRRPIWPGAQTKHPGQMDKDQQHKWKILNNFAGVHVQNLHMKSGITSGKFCRRILGGYLLYTSIHFFLKRLADGELVAVGVAEGDLMTLKETKIPIGWWRREILLDLGRNEMWELMGPNPEPLVRRYSEVRIQKPTASQKRRQRGRPSRGEELVKAFHELWNSGCLTKDGLRNKKGVWAEVLEHLDYSPQTPGCSYNSFVQHVGPHIDQSLQTRDSEN